ncbi:hypothetical protein [Marisediminicola sp. LYQ134]|uniref:hypothetical protein n=1 Tax=unclassified Marisediminicola TaxID=2618316 RepID=UPI003983673E
MNTNLPSDGTPADSNSPLDDGSIPADADLVTSNDADGESDTASEPGVDPEAEDEKDRAERHY